MTMIDQFLLQADIYRDMILDLKEKMEKTIGEERPSLGDRLDYIFARKQLDYKNHCMNHMNRQSWMILLFNSLI